MDIPPRLPVAIIGAGPIGLAAAAHLHQRGLPFVVLEAGSEVAAAMRQWAHIRLFSPWSYVVDDAARALLETTGWNGPCGDTHPTGGEVVREYIEPLAALPAIAPHIRLGTRVIATSRFGADKLKSVGREALPFELVVETTAGTERMLASAIIDASGTWEHPNPLGPGVPAAGETAAARFIDYRVPDVLGVDRKSHAGAHTVVIGAGHSAFNAVLDLASLAAQEPGTRITWAVRRDTLGAIFGGGENDALEQRGLLGDKVRALVEDGTVDLVTGFRTTRIRTEADRVVVEGGAPDGRTAALPAADRVVATTGFRPDLSVHRELRLELDPIVETTPTLAPLIDPNLHSCGTVRPHGAAELAHPEVNFFVVGMKSYGRAPTFLLLTGYEQVRSVVAALDGDHAAATDVHLVLPETGVCSLDAGI